MDLSFLLMIVALFAAMYFLMIRPGQKRAREQQALMKELGPGARVMLSSGVFGTIRYWGEKQAVVEISPGVELTVLKQAVVRPVKDDEDEFEYADVDEPAAAAVGTDAALAEPGTYDPLPADDVEQPATTNADAYGQPATTNADAYGQPATDEAATYEPAAYQPGTYEPGSYQPNSSYQPAYQSGSTPEAGTQTPDTDQQAATGEGPLTGPADAGDTGPRRQQN